MDLIICSCLANKVVEQWYKQLSHYFWRLFFLTEKQAYDDISPLTQFCKQFSPQNGYISVDCVTYESNQTLYVPFTGRWFLPRPVPSRTIPSLPRWSPLLFTLWEDTLCFYIIYLTWWYHVPRSLTMNFVHVFGEPVKQRNLKRQRAVSNESV